MNHDPNVDPGIAEAEEQAAAEDTDYWLEQGDFADSEGED